MNNFIKYTTTKDETPSGLGKGFQVSNNVFEFTPNEGRLANIIAQMAVAGHTVHELEHGFLVCRWGMTKVCPDLAALVGFARQLGVRHA